MRAVRATFILIPVSIALLSGCLAEPPGEIGDTSSPIIGGSPTRGVANVVAVVRSGSTGGLCSGTVVSRYAVLTAKHCVYTESDSGGHTAVPARELTVVVGHDLNVASGVIEAVGVREVHTTPGSDIDRDIEAGDDVAILLLQTRIGVGRRVLGTAPPEVGAEVGIVGYGRTTPGTDEEASAGVKYNGRATVRRVFGGLIETRGSSWTCRGDSGGPLINVDDSRIVGVTSFGREGCYRSNSFYARVDRHLSWINPLLRWEPPCMPEDERCGDSIDNDCDGVVDEDCTALGAPCRSTDECESGRCEDVGAGQVCVRDCDAQSAIPLCPFGFYCEAVACGEGRCIEGEPGSLAAGSECTSNVDCASNHCVSVGGVTRCGRQCDSERASCGDGTLCEPDDAGCGVCLPPELTSRPRPFGVACEEDSECVSGRCRTGFCTDACDMATPCPSGFHCRGGECVRGDLGGPGDECFTEEDCGELAPDCVNIDGDLLCAPPCGGMGDCPDDFVCTATATGMHCAPPGLPLGADCGSNEACRSGICAGVCTRLCGDEMCPDGFVCLPAGEHHGCFREPTGMGAPGADGGCAVGLRSSGTAWLTLVLLGLFWTGRRRRRVS